MSEKNYKTLVLPDKYVPKKTEKYMSIEQRAYFYQILTAQKKELEEELNDSINEVDLGSRMDSVGAMDDGDRAALSVDADLSIKMRERAQSLLQQIDAALGRLENETYGYSVISGEEIGLKRLMLRPVATMTVEEKEEREK